MDVLIRNLLLFVYLQNVFHTFYPTDSSSIRCDCTKNCGSKKVESKLERYFLDRTIEQSNEKLLYKNDSTAIKKWSQWVDRYNSQVAQYTPQVIQNNLQVANNSQFRPQPFPETLYDHLTVLPSPPMTPRKRKWSTSSCGDSGNLADAQWDSSTNGSDSWIGSNVLSERSTNEMELLIGAADFIESNPAYKSWHRSTPRTNEFNDQFADLLLLAEEAVKRTQTAGSTKV